MQTRKETHAFGALYGHIHRRERGGGCVQKNTSHIGVISNYTEPDMQISVTKRRCSPLAESAKNNGNT